MRKIKGRPRLRPRPPEVSTGASAVRARAATGLLGVALLAGPAGLFVACSAQGSPPVTESGPPVDVRAPAVVGEFASRFVAAWLTTGRDHPDRLAGYGPEVDEVDLPAVGLRTGAPQVAAVDDLGSDLWSVTVAVAVAPPGSQPVSTSVDRRYFTVPVRYIDGATVALTLPAPAPAPPPSDPPTLGYNVDMPAGSAAEQTVAAFLSAYTTGRGDMTRYLTPGAQVSPLHPALFTGIEVVDLAVVGTDPNDLTSAPTGQPADGQVLKVLATAEGDTDAAAGYEQLLPVQYALSLTARAGRWEVTAIDPAPVLAGQDSTVHLNSDASPDGEGIDTGSR